MFLTLNLYHIIFILYRAEKDSGKIYIYDAKGQAEPLSVLDRLHTQPVLLIRVSSLIEPFIFHSQTYTLK